MSICTSILSKNHYLNSQNKLKETKCLAFKELLPKKEIVSLMKGDNHRERVYTASVALMQRSVIKVDVIGKYNFRNIRSNKCWIM